MYYCHFFLTYNSLLPILAPLEKDADSIFREVKKIAVMLQLNSNLEDYYNSRVWMKTSFLGVPCLKAVTDMWNYQEIIYQLKPTLLIEFGTAAGGSTLFFDELLKIIYHDQSNKYHILTVDIDPTPIHQKIKNKPTIEILTTSSLNPLVKEKIIILKKLFPGPLFAILDSNHTKAHVFQEIVLMNEILNPGDYLIVEDTIINNPLPFDYEGPMEALKEYMNEYPQCFRLDKERMEKFGLTFAPLGYLVKV